MDVWRDTSGNDESALASHQTRSKQSVFLHGREHDEAISGVAANAQKEVNDVPRQRSKLLSSLSAELGWNQNRVWSNDGQDEHENWMRLNVTVTAAVSDC